MYRVSYGHFQKYNVRKCFGCGEIKPKNKKPASIEWRCDDCVAAAKAKKDTDQ